MTYSNTVANYAAKSSIGGEAALLAALKQQKAQMGCLQDDNNYFTRAVELMDATQGQTTVYVYEVEISEETLSNIQSWYTENREAPYNFPNDGGRFKRGESNCATFWQRFSIPLPVLSGNIREIIQVMDEEGYAQWLND